MNIRQLLWKELLHRKANSVLALAVVVATVALIVASLLLLDAYRLQTERQVSDLDDEIRKITKNLGFNIHILPRDQNLADFYAQDFGEKTMSQSLVSRLADSKDIVTINHLRPALIRKIHWPEQNRQIVLMGVTGVVPWTHRQNTKVPLAQAVPPGKISVGAVLAEQAKLKAGDELVLKGQKFNVHEVYPARGNKDDITAWIDLATAQQMLELPDQINMIQALECNCASIDRLAEIEAEISHVLGDEVQAIELSTKAIARAKARNDVKKSGKQKLASLQRATLIGFALVTVVSSLILAIIFFRNAIQRLSEIGILRAIGVTKNQVMMLFLGKSLLLGLVGGVVGFGIGAACVFVVGPQLLAEFYTPTTTGMLALPVVLGAPLITMLATWIPIELVAGMDPARILREGA